MLPESLTCAFSPGFFRTDSESLEKYGQDWSGVLKAAPCAIAFPRTTEDVSKLLALCTKERLAVVPSGGRTGLSGGAVAAKGELVISLEKMNQVLAFEPAAFTLLVQAGMITETVHDYLKPHGLTWPVDFASKGSSHIGGNISTNAGGVRVIRYGNTRNWVLGLKVVTMNGQILDLTSALEKNNTGTDLTQVFIGSEGTLGVITEAQLKLAKLPDEDRTQVALFSLEGFQEVLTLFSEARQAPFELSAFECMTAPCMAEVEKKGLKNPITEKDSLYALVEFEERAPGQGHDWIEGLLAKEGLVRDGVLAQNSKEKKNLWALREQIAEAVMHGSEVHQQDLSVPIPKLKDFAVGIEARYREKYPDFEIFIFGHIGDGNLHIFIRKPESMKSDAFHASCAKQDVDLFELTRTFRGSVSAEHGVGLLKKPALSYTRDESETEYLRGLKRVFDPMGLLNPGKMIDL